MAASGAAVAAPPLRCRDCFWSAEITRQAARVWCAHRVWNGWKVDQDCGGDGYRQDPDSRQG